MTKTRGAPLFTIAENLVFGRKLSAWRNTRDTSRILCTWRECAHVLGHDYVAEKFPIGKATLINYRFSLSLSDADAIGIARRTLSNNVVDRRLVIKPASLCLVYRSDSVSETTCRLQSQPRSRGITRCSRQMRRCTGE